MEGRRLFDNWLWLFGAGVLASMVACSSDTYSCSSDDQCTNGDTPGICQPETGWCSFEDSQCPSMQRYGALAAKSLANTCVPLPQEQTSGLPSTPEPPTPQTLEGTSTGETSGTTFDDEGSGDGTITTTATSTSTATSTTTGSTGGFESSGSGPDMETTGDPNPDCMPILFDDFADGVLDPGWNTWSDPGTSLNEDQSSLRFSVVGQVNSSADTGISSMDLFDLNEGQMRVEVAEFPTLSSSMRLYMQFDAGACDATIVIEDDVIYAFGEAGTIGDDTVWLELRTDGAFRHAERSVDGVAWEPIVPPQPIECDMSQTRVYLFGGTNGASAAGPTTAVETLEACVGGP
ncbi:MAG: hypothetical protein AAGF11_08275 [Myxococcota bacterium]